MRKRCIATSAMVTLAAVIGQLGLAASASRLVTMPGTFHVNAYAPAFDVQRSNSAGAQASARLTPEDLEGRMKKIGPAATSLQKHLMASQLMDASKDAQDLGSWLGDVERFWAQRNTQDAVKWAQQARRAATDIAGAGIAGDAKKANQATKTMLEACGMCHMAHREMDDAGGYRIKGPA